MILTAFKFWRAVLVVMSLSITTLAQAHPHNWIDVFAEWRFDPNGLITDVKLRWLFDDYYSVLLVDDAAATGDKLQVILNKVLGNTKKHDYFIQIDQQGTKAKFGDAKQAKIGVHDHRIQIEFLLSMKTPLNPKQGDIVYHVVEPTYYFEMLHAEDDLAIVLKDAPQNCRYSLKPPTPAAAMIAYASSLGIDETGGDDLGIEFAEAVTIRCE